MSPSPSASAPATSRAATSPSRWASKSSSTLKAISRCYVISSQPLPPRSMQAKKHIYLIGICGTAMASLAGLLQLKGHRITGSDQAAYPPMSNLLRDLGIPIAEPFSASNLEPAPDLIIVGNALSRGNVEVEAMLDRRIPFTSLARVIHEEFIAGHESLVVAGTHGKTTTTSMLAWLFTRSPRAATRSLRHRSSLAASRRTSAPAFISARGARSSSRAMSTTPRSSTRARSSCIISPMR